MFYQNFCGQELLLFVADTALCFPERFSLSLSSIQRAPLYISKSLSLSLSITCVYVMFVRGFRNHCLPAAL